jgi:integrase
MMAALELAPKGSISPHTYHHLFGLLAATGLRISEALALKRNDLTDDGLIVRSGKLGKSRLLPIHPTTRQALNRYLAVRDRLNAGGDDLFAVTTGRAPQKSTVYQVFRRLAHQLGLRDLGRTPGPRVHDLRHTFAVRSLEACALDQALRIRALPKKRTDAVAIDYLTREEIQALLAAPDARTASGTRDRAMLHLTLRSGLARRRALVAAPG